MATGDVTATHAFQSSIDDDQAAAARGEVLPSHWNASHTLSGMSEFQASVKDVAAVSMSNDNYTMTDTEAIAALKFMSNTGTGKTLTIPSTAFAYLPAIQIYANTFGNAFTLTLQGLTSITIPAGRIVTVLNEPDSGLNTIVNMTASDGTYARQESTDQILLTSTALRGTAVANEIECLNQNMYFSPSASNRAIVATPHIVQLTSAVTLVDDTSTQDLFGATYGEFNCDANTTYHVEGILDIVKGTNNVRFDVAWGGTATIDSLLVYWDTYPNDPNSGGATNVNGTQSQVAKTAVSFATANPGEGKSFKGILRVSTAGTIKLQGAFSGATGSTPSVAANSYIKYTPMAADTNQSVGDFT